MSEQVLAPSVENAEDANLRAEVLSSGRDFQERGGAGLEEQAVKETLILIGARGQRVRQGEDHMHVANGE